MNARKGIKTLFWALLRFRRVSLKTMNARKGIKTLGKDNIRRVRDYMLKTMNARKGIKTRMVTVFARRYGWLKTMNARKGIKTYHIINGFFI